jgi:hypothetical protein
MPIRKISIKITRRESDGIYQIQSLTGAVFVHVKSRGSDDEARVGDEVTEAEVQSLCNSYSSNVTITRIKG